MSVDQLKELIPFLHDRNPQVRHLALSNLLGHTPKESSHRDVFFAGLRGGGLQKVQDTELIRDLKLLCRDQLAIAHDAFRALINLSDNSVLANSLSETSFLQFVVSYILNTQSTLADLASMLLSNLTASASTCTTLLKMTIPILPDPKSSTSYYPVESRSGTCLTPVPYPTGDPRDVPALPLLIDAFLQGAAAAEIPDADAEKRPRKGSLHFLSSVFANMTTVPAGRTFFLTPRPSKSLETDPDGALEYPLAKLLVFTEHKDLIRRGGVASTLKNCAFHRPAHRAMLTPDSEFVAVPPSTVDAPGMDVLPALLLPLAGPEEFDLDTQELLPTALQFLPPTKTREADPALRLIHVETLLLLCSTRWGREHLRKRGVYEVVRALHVDEKADNVLEYIERLVNMLMRDEGPGTEVDEELEVPSHITEVDVDAHADAEEDEDEMITEV